MKSFISTASCAVAGLLLAASAVHAYPQLEDTEPPARATILYTDGGEEQSIELSVGRRGELIRSVISALDVTKARVSSDVPMKCFFSRQLEAGENPVTGYEVISEIFTNGDAQEVRYQSADRLYCYASADEEYENNTFKVFVMTEDGSYGLVPLDLTEPTFAEVYMVPTYASLAKSPSGAAIVHHPRVDEPGWDANEQVRCGFVTPTGNSFIGVENGVKFGDNTNIQRIGCSLDSFEGRVKNVG